MKIIMNILNYIQEHYMRKSKLILLFYYNIIIKMIIKGLVYNFEGKGLGRKINIGNPDNYHMPFGRYKNYRYKEVYLVSPAYVRWILEQKNIQRLYPFMYSYFLNRIKEHDED